MSQSTRAHQRFQIRLSADVAAGGRQFTATTRNLSAGGVCLESAYPFEEGGSLGLSLFLVVDDVEDESMPPLEVRGTVQWTADDDEEHVHIAGVQFSEISDAQRAWLESFLARSGTD